MEVVPSKEEGVGYPNGGDGIPIISDGALVSFVLPAFFPFVNIGALGLCHICVLTVFECKQPGSFALISVLFPVFVSEKTPDAWELLPIRGRVRSSNSYVADVSSVREKNELLPVVTSTLMRAMSENGTSRSPP